jgi:DNA-binding NarL/FixJ family response regulator
MSHFHAVVWIDHKQAHVFHFNADDAEKLTLRAQHAASDERYLHSVAQAVADAGEILVTGPAGTKTELVKHIAAHDPQLLARVVGVESSDHPTDGQIVAHARHYFQSADKKIAQKA